MRVSSTSTGTTFSRTCICRRCGEQFTANLGKAKSEGGDIEVIYRPIPALTFDLTAAYTDARLTKSSCAGSLTYDIAESACVRPLHLACRLRGRSPPTAMRCSARRGRSPGSAEYHFPEWAGRMPYLRIDYQHQTAQSTRCFRIQDANNALYRHDAAGPPVVNNLSLRAGMRFNGLDLSVYANNVTNSNPLMFDARDIYPTRDRREPARLSSVRRPITCTSGAACGRAPSASRRPTATEFSGGLRTHRQARRRASPGPAPEATALAFPCHTASVSGRALSAHAVVGQDLVGGGHDRLPRRTPAPRRPSDRIRWSRTDP